MDLTTSKDDVNSLNLQNSDLERKIIESKRQVENIFSKNEMLEKNLNIVEDVKCVEPFRLENDNLLKVLTECLKETNV